MITGNIDKSGKSLDMQINFLIQESQRTVDTIPEIGGDKHVYVWTVICKAWNK